MRFTKRNQNGPVFEKNSSVVFFSTLIFLYNMGNSLEVFIICLTPSDKPVGAGLRALVCVFQLPILTADVRRTTATVRILTKTLVVALFHAMVRF